jgi:predicted trehalose synthase
VSLALLCSRHAGFLSARPSQCRTSSSKTRAMRGRMPPAISTGFSKRRGVLPELPTAADSHAAYLNRVRQIGRRTGELHLALASSTEDSAFAPEPVTAEDVADWTAGLVSAAEAMFEELARCYDQLGPRAKPIARTLLARRWEAVEQMRGLLPPAIDVDKVRQHGDFHLGQISFARLCGDRRTAPNPGNCGGGPSAPLAGT